MNRGSEWWNTFFLKIAEHVSTASKDPSTKCGAVITDMDKHILSVGYNGFPTGMDDIDDRYVNREEKLSRIIHCEMNALLHVGLVPQGCTLYTYPFMSCDRCVVHMLQAGIKAFVAPKLTIDGARWKDSIERTKAYIVECGGSYVEV
jgi:dCMP deaminase